MTDSVDQDLIESLVSHYQTAQNTIGLFRDQLMLAISSSDELEPLVHSTKTRLKDPEHLREKLHRKIATFKSKLQAEITVDSLFTIVTDLAGIRILHLYTRQIAEINRILLEIFEEQRYELLEGPFARTWDDESRAFFRGCGIETQDSPTLYTSVHYVVGSASRTPVTCEIQVRTLMEEVWGEVDHMLNYPSPTADVAIKEQLMVLARVTSSATRLVDAIFTTQSAII